MREIVFDTETTGLFSAQHRLVSLAAIELVDYEPTGNYLSLFFNPDRESDPRALEVHGLTTEFLSTQPRFQQRAVEIEEFIRDDALVIHNASFDSAFLNAELLRAGRSKAANRTICTLKRAQEIHGRFGNKLDDLVRRYEIPNLREATGKHGALIDTLLLVNVYRRLRNLPILDLDLSKFGVDNGSEGKQSARSASVDPLAGTVPAGVDVGPGRDRVGQVLGGNLGLSYALKAGRAEPASPTTGSTPSCSEVGDVAGGLHCSGMGSVGAQA